MAGELGLEPRLTESESVILPLDDSPMIMKHYTKFILLSILISCVTPQNEIKSPKVSNYLKGEVLKSLKSEEGYLITPLKIGISWKTQDSTITADIMSVSAVMSNDKGEEFILKTSGNKGEKEVHLDDKQTYWELHTPEMIKISEGDYTLRTFRLEKRKQGRGYKEFTLEKQDFVIKESLPFTVRSGKLGILPAVTYELDLQAFQLSSEEDPLWKGEITQKSFSQPTLTEEWKSKWDVYADDISSFYAASSKYPVMRIKHQQTMKLKEKDATLGFFLDVPCNFNQQFTMIWHKDTEDVDHEIVFPIEKDLTCSHRHQVFYPINFPAGEWFLTSTYVGKETHLNHPMKVIVEKGEGVLPSYYLGKYSLESDAHLGWKVAFQKTYHIDAIQHAFQSKQIFNGFVPQRLTKDRISNRLKTALRSQNPLPKGTVREQLSQPVSQCIRQREKIDTFLNVEGTLYFRLKKGSTKIDFRRLSLTDPEEGDTYKWLKECIQHKLLSLQLGATPQDAWEGELYFTIE